MIRGMFILALVGLFHAGLAGAQTPSEVASFKKWSAYKLKQDRGTAFYLATQPSSSRPKGVKRSAIWLFVTHRPFDKVRDEVSLHMGYPLKKDSNVVVEIDGRKKYDLFGHGETAWAKTPPGEPGQHRRHALFGQPAQRDLFNEAFADELPKRLRQRAGHFEFHVPISPDH